jgi:hypothetical protein
MVSDDGQFRLRNGRRPVLTMRVHMDDEQHGHLHPIEDK